MPTAPQVVDEFEVMSFDFASVSRELEEYEEQLAREEEEASLGSGKASAAGEASKGAAAAGSDVGDVLVPDASSFDADLIREVVPRLEQMQHLQDKCGQLERIVAEREEELRSKDEQLEQLQRRLAEAQRPIDAKTEQGGDEKLQNLAAQLEELRKSEGDLVARIASEQSMNDALEKTRSELEQRLRNAEIANVEGRAYACEVNDKLGVAQEENQRLKDQIKALLIEAQAATATAASGGGPQVPRPPLDAEGPELDTLQICIAQAVRALKDTVPDVAPDLAEPSTVTDVVVNASTAFDHLCQALHIQQGSKITLERFAPGDVALFHPTTAKRASSTRHYVAFASHDRCKVKHMLSEESKAFINKASHFREGYVMGRIVHKELQTAIRSDPSSGALKEGTKYYSVTIEALPFK